MYKIFFRFQLETYFYVKLEISPLGLQRKSSFTIKSQLAAEQFTAAVLYTSTADVLKSLIKEHFMPHFYPVSEEILEHVQANK